MSTTTITTITAPAGRITGHLRDRVRYFHSLPFCEIPDAFGDAVKLSGPREIDARTPAPEEVALSITAPERVSDAPVVVYIHGGRFDSGSHVDPRAEGTVAARAGLVQVNVGYRVGVEGFAQFQGENPASFRGIDDIQLALEWIQRNIESFGGDPTNVTLVGQSAGATAALWLCRRDHYRGAFRRVLAASPAFAFESFAARRATLRKALKAPVTRQSLHGLEPARIDAAYEKFRRTYRLGIALGPAMPDFAELADVPIVVTSTRDEFFDIELGRKLDASPLRGLIGRFVADKYHFSHGAYPEWLGFAKSMDSKRVLGRMIGDAAIRRWVAQLADTAPGQTWMVEFVGTSPVLHCQELPHLFGDGDLGRWLHRFARTGEPGFAPYRPDHTVWEYDLERAAGRMTYGSLDYVDSAFNRD